MWVYDKETKKELVRATTLDDVTITIGSMAPFPDPLHGGAYPSVTVYDYRHDEDRVRLRRQDAADAALVVGEHQRSSPTLLQLPSPCRAVNGSLLYPVAISAPLVLGGKGRRIGAPPRIALISGRGSTRSGAVLVGIAESWGGALGAPR